MQMDWNYPEIIALHSEATTLIFGFRGDPFDFLANRPNVKKKQISCMQLLESLLNIATQCLACLPLTILRFHWAHIWKDHTANQTIGNLAVPAWRSICLCRMSSCGRLGMCEWELDVEVTSVDIFWRCSRMEQKSCIAFFHLLQEGKADVLQWKNEDRLPIATSMQKET